MCSFEGTILLLKDRGLVKWYDRGLQNLWWEFDSLIPCNEMRKAFKMEGCGYFFFANLIW